MEIGVDPGWIRPSREATRRPASSSSSSSFRCLREKAGELSFKLPPFLPVSRSISRSCSRHPFRVRCVEDPKWNWRRAREYVPRLFDEMGFFVSARIMYVYTFTSFSRMIRAPIVCSRSDFQKLFNQESDAKKTDRYKPSSNM